MAGEGMVLNADVSSPEDVSRMVGEIVSKWGRLDVLVNNAATIVSRTNLGDTPVEAWDRMMGVNVRGVFLCCKEALAVMEKQGAGSIVNIASVSGQRGQPSNSAYSTSKGAIMNMTRSLAVDYGPKGIRINSVSPALVDTEMARTRLKPGEDWDERAAREWIPNYPIGPAGQARGHRPRRPVPRLRSGLVDYRDRLDHGWRFVGEAVSIPSISFCGDVILRE